MLGFRGVGKSSLVAQFVDGHFSESYYPTIENTLTKTITVNGQVYNAEIIDTAGQDEYSILNSRHALGIHGYILVYSITSRNSLEMCSVIRDKILNFTGTNYVPIVMVGNKCDLNNQRQVTFDQAQELCGDWKCAVTEASAKQNLNVSKAFELMLQELEKHPSNSLESSESLNKRASSSKLASKNQSSSNCLLQ